MRARAKGSVWARRLALLARQTLALRGRFPGTRLGALYQARRLERCDGCSHAWHMGLSWENEPAGANKSRGER